MRPIFSTKLTGLASSGALKKPRGIPMGRWVSSSLREPFATSRKWTNSLECQRPKPSALLAGIETAAPHLRSQPILFVLRQAVHKLVAFGDQIHRFLPRHENLIDSFQFSFWTGQRSSSSRELLPTTHQSLPILLELRFDGMDKFFVANQTLNFFHDLAIAGDEETGGIAEKTAELVGDVVAADDDGIIHGEFLAVDVETFLGEEGSDGALAFFVHGDAENGEAFRFVLLLHLNEPGNFDVAGLAPGGPEIDEDDFAFVLGKGGAFAVQIFEGDFGGGLADGLVVGLLGVLLRACRFDARGLIGVVGADDERDDGGHR